MPPWPPGHHATANTIYIKYISERIRQLTYARSGFRARLLWMSLIFFITFFTSFQASTDHNVCVVTLLKHVVMLCNSILFWVFDEFINNFVDLRVEVWFPFLGKFCEFFVVEAFTTWTQASAQTTVHWKTLIKKTDEKKLTKKTDRIF